MDCKKNIGYCTLLAARLVGPHGRVYSFESDPLNFYILNKNVTVNGYTNVILCKKVVSDETRQIRLYIAQTNMGDHRIYDQEDGRKSIVIDSVRLDDFLYIHDKPVDIIKIDI